MKLGELLQKGDNPDETASFEHTIGPAHLNAEVSPELLEQLNTTKNRLAKWIKGSPVHPKTILKLRDLATAVKALEESLGSDR